MILQKLDNPKHQEYETNPNNDKNNQRSTTLQYNSANVYEYHKYTVLNTAFVEK